MQQIKSFTLFAVVLFCFSSCKKNKADTNVSLGTISATIAGTTTTFNYGAKATVLSVSGGYGISITGYKKEPSSSQTNLFFSVVRPIPITIGTYVENSGNNPLVEMSYAYDLIFGIVYTSETYGSTTNPVTISITDISSISVKGTFSGELLGTDATGNQVKTLITNGIFYVSF